MTKKRQNPNDAKKSAIGALLVSRASFDIRHSSLPHPISARDRQLYCDFFENPVCFLQRLFASNIEPLALDLERFNGFARVEPLHKAARLIRVIAGS